MDRPSLFHVTTILGALVVIGVYLLVSAHTGVLFGILFLMLVPVLYELH